MTIKINEKEITLKYTFRAMMIYEKITKTSFQPKGITEILIYFYSTILAADKDSTLSFEDFMDWIDENPSALTDFSNWLTAIIGKNAYINNSEKTEEQDQKNA